MNIRTRGNLGVALEVALAKAATERGHGFNVPGQKADVVLVNDKTKLKAARRANRGALITLLLDQDVDKEAFAELKRMGASGVLLTPDPQNEDRMRRFIELLETLKE